MHKKARSLPLRIQSKWYRCALGPSIVSKRKNLLVDILCGGTDIQNGLNVGIMLLESSELRSVFQLKIVYRMHPFPTHHDVLRSIRFNP
mmetsp:Transcript_14344/g.29379  ORF Transcript_14344/g.29379 Transcript_14344/m.29379 type:complete len:89 (+) Transcript_14344:285-551(+)